MAMPASMGVFTIVFAQEYSSTSGNLSILRCLAILSANAYLNRNEIEVGILENKILREGLNKRKMREGEFE